jgi:hypothetical protein
MGMGGARRRAVRVLSLGLAATAGCVPGDRKLVAARHLPIDVDSAATLHVDAAGRFWIGGAGAAVVLDEGGAELFRVPTPGEAAPEFAASAVGVMHLQAGDTLVAVDASTGARKGARDGFAGVVLRADARGRYLLQGAASGAVLGFDPVTLEPRWGWAARGAPTTALATAPEGNVVWQALEVGENAGLLLERDLQTGRVLEVARMFDRIAGLEATPGGDLIAVIVGTRRVHVILLRPRGSSMTQVWRSVVDLDGSRAVRTRYAAAAGMVAVFTPGSEAGLRVLDAKTGESSGFIEDAPLDAAFGPDGALYLLYPRQLLRVRKTS